MTAFEKQNFYNGQSIAKADLNDSIIAYGVKNLEHLTAAHLGMGAVSGFNPTMEGGFAMGIGPGLGYDSQGRRLWLEAGKQTSLSALAPTTGNAFVLVGAVQAFTETLPALDNQGNTVYTKLTETVNFVHGAALPPEALPLCRAQLSSAGILSIEAIAPILETAQAAAIRTRGFTNSAGALSLKGSSAIFTRPDGFTLDLIEARLRRTAFDPLHGPYKKGDILWLEPPTYATQHTPPELPAPGGAAYPYTIPATSNFMGKTRTLSKPTDYKQQAVRLRASIDNPRNPSVVGAIGTDWAVDEPAAIVEEGSNSNGSYTMYAGGMVYCSAERTNTSGFPTWTYPIVLTTTPFTIASGRYFDTTAYRAISVYTHSWTTSSVRFMGSTQAAGSTNWDTYTGTVFLEFTHTWY